MLQLTDINSATTAITDDDMIGMELCIDVIVSVEIRKHFFGIYMILMQEERIFF